MKTTDTSIAVLNDNNPCSTNKHVQFHGFFLQKSLHSMFLYVNKILLLDNEQYI